MVFEIIEFVQERCAVTIQRDPTFNFNKTDKTGEKMVKLPSLLSRKDMILQDVSVIQP